MRPRLVIGLASKLTALCFHAYPNDHLQGNQCQSRQSAIFEIAKIYELSHRLMVSHVVGVDFKLLQGESDAYQDQDRGDLNCDFHMFKCSIILDMKPLESGTSL